MTQIKYFISRHTTVSIIVPTRTPQFICLILQREKSKKKKKMSVGANRPGQTLQTEKMSSMSCLSSLLDES